MGTKTWDVKSLELAEAFLLDEDWYKRLSVSERKPYADQVASEIQQAVESEIEMLRDSPFEPWNASNAEKERG